jgi:hypothetical protein
MWEALIPQSPAKLSFAALLGRLRSVCMNRAHAMRSIIVYSSEGVEGYSLKFGDELLRIIDIARRTVAPYPRQSSPWARFARDVGWIAA